MDRFFFPELPDSQPVVLDGDEFHHLVHVLRAKPGDQVELFDGRGHAATAVIDATTKREARLSLTSDVQQDPPELVRVVLAVACPKGDRLKWMIEKACELGVTELIPLSCERSVVEPRESRLTKLEQTVLAACKQSRRNVLMQLGEPRSLTQLVDQIAPVSSDPAARPRLNLVAHPGGSGAGATIRQFVTSATGTSASPDQPAGTITAVIGPEGGLTDREVALLLERGVVPLTIGRSILRVETAALAVAALLRSELTH